MERRTFMVASALAAWQTTGAAASPPERRGHLVIIGGAEDRTGEMLVLRRFVELLDSKDPRVLVLSAASGAPSIVWGRYDYAFGQLGVRRREHLAVASPQEADAPAIAERVLQADGLLMTGGDQRRLMSAIGGSLLERQLRFAHRKQGLSIAGTSAGAAAMSRYMLAGRAMEEGLGLVPHAVIDQHFSQRRRLARLVRAVAGRPELIGVGVDEDTALVIAPSGGFEVVGSGEVTLVDGRRLPPPGEDADADTLLRQPQMQVTRLLQGPHRRGADDSLRDTLSLLRI